MKILRIELENFASHLHSIIDLSQITSATVSGKNGTGKSTAFVDAPLWALFGKCRSEPDAMMAHDQLRMCVTVDFSLDGQRYRVQRIRSKATKAGKTELSFLAFNEEGPPVPVGGHKVTETQEAIKSVLNADYELCANSNFLIQGHADRFSVATPSERKAILSQVLRLDEYAALKTLANRKGSIEGDLIKIQEQQTVPLEAQVNSVMDLKAKIKEAESDLEKASSAQIQVSKELQDYSELKGKKQAALDEILASKEGLDQLLFSREELNAKILKNKTDQTYYQGLIGKKSAIELQTIQKEKLLETMSLKKDKEVQLMKGLLELENELRLVMERKEREVETLSRVSKELLVLDNKRDLAISQQQVEVQKQGDKIGQDLRKIELLEKVPCWEDLQKKCRFTLEAIEAREGLQVERDRFQILEKRDFVSEQLPDYAADRKTREEQIKTLEASEILVKAEELKQRRQTIELEKSGVTLELSEMKQMIEECEPLAKLKPDLDAALKESAVLESSMGLLLASQADLTKQIEAKQAKASEEKALTDWLAEHSDDQKRLQNKSDFFAGELQGITERLGRLRQQCEGAELSRVQLQEIKTKLVEMRDRLSALKILHTYYTTIPVMIMEGAVPQLEASTNSILEKISPSGMRVRLETQKALKSSERIGETLDILVRDVFGEKPYENYSGGEKFRLDLALRFGLSQLLMHRAGSKMETLVIDEGLGSLDQDGLTLLRECLSNLETDFGLILVISHVEEIQGTFEQQIMVEKNSKGSEIRIL